MKLVCQESGGRAGNTFIVDEVFGNWTSEHEIHLSNFGIGESGVGYGEGEVERSGHYTRPGFCLTRVSREEEPEEVEGTCQS